MNTEFKEALKEVYETYERIIFDRDTTPPLFLVEVRDHLNKNNRIVQYG